MPVVPTSSPGFMPQMASPVSPTRQNAPILSWAFDLLTYHQPKELPLTRRRSHTEVSPISTGSASPMTHPSKRARMSSPTPDTSLMKDDGARMISLPSSPVHPSLILSLRPRQGPNVSGHLDGWSQKCSGPSTSRGSRTTKSREVTNTLPTQKPATAQRRGVSVDPPSSPIIPPSSRRMVHELSSPVQPPRNQQGHRKTMVISDDEGDDDDGSEWGPLAAMAARDARDEREGHQHGGTSMKKPSTSSGAMFLKRRGTGAKAKHY
jgi:hypothetical protein